MHMYALYIWYMWLYDISGLRSLNNIYYVKMFLHSHLLIFLPSWQEHHKFGYFRMFYENVMQQDYCECSLKYVEVFKVKSFLRIAKIQFKVSPGVNANHNYLHRRRSRKSPWEFPKFLRIVATLKVLIELSQLI